MEEKVIKRGYVKWTDEDGVFHKEPLADHPELLAKADPAEQLRAEEVRRMNASAEEYVADIEDTRDEDLKEALVELKAAPEEVLTAAQLTDVAPDSGAEEDGEKSEEVERLQEDADTDHEAALRELREKTAE